MEREYDDIKGEAEIAPVFDCGSCLLPQADDKVMKKVLANEAELHARVFQFPTSAIKLKGRKINYYDFLSRAENEDANEALTRYNSKLYIIYNQLIFMSRFISKDAYSLVVK